MILSFHHLWRAACFKRLFQEAAGFLWGLLLCSIGQPVLREWINWTLGSTEINQDAMKSNTDALCCDFLLASLYERHFIKISCVVTWFIGHAP